ncbi:MAG TPA: protein kinase, partial [Actinomycetes bacterium]|nr:protein kinase [Actinomycetes bacterium]
DRLRRQAAVLQVLDHSHVVRLHRLLLSEGEVVLVTGLAAGGSLDGLLARRGRLSAGEVVTIGTPLAQALAAVHARGLVHGTVGPRAVLFTAEGRPLWSDLGLAWARGTTCSAADDVYRLGALLRDAFDGAPALGGDLPEADEAGVLGAPEPVLPPALASALTAACDPDPTARPSAAELAVMLYDAVAATPVRLAASNTADDSTRSLSPTIDRAPAVSAPARDLPDVVVLGSSPSQPRSLRRSVASGSARSRTRSLRRPVASSRARSRTRGRLRSWRPPVGRARGPFVAMVVAAVLLLAVGGWRWWSPGGALPSEAALTTSVPTEGVSVSTGDGSGSTSSGSAPTSRGPVSGTSGSMSSSGELPDTAKPVDPDVAAAQVLAQLDAKRSVTYANGDLDALGLLYTPWSLSRDVDMGNLQRLVDAGERAQGFRTDAISVRVITRSPDAMELAVVDTIPQFTVVGANGTPVRVESGRAERSFRIALERVDGQWLYDTVDADTADADTVDADTADADTLGIDAADAAKRS